MASPKQQTKPARSSLGEHPFQQLSVQFAPLRLSRADKPAVRFVSNEQLQLGQFLFMGKNSPASDAESRGRSKILLTV